MLFSVGDSESQPTSSAAAAEGANARKHRVQKERNPADVALRIEPFPRRSQVSDETTLVAQHESQSPNLTDSRRDPVCQVPPDRPAVSDGLSIGKSAPRDTDCSEHFSSGDAAGAFPSSQCANGFGRYRRRRQGPLHSNILFFRLRIFDAEHGR